MKNAKKYLVIREIDILLNEGDESMIEDSIVGIFDTEKEAEQLRDKLESKEIKPRDIVKQYNNGYEGFECADENPEGSVTVMYEVQPFDGQDLTIACNIVNNNA